MKVINKYLVIALLLSLIFSVSAVAAQENMTFEQSDSDTETLTVSSEDAQEIESVEDENEELLKASEDDQLNEGEGTFNDVKTKINAASNGGTIYLDGKTYLGSGSSIEIKKDLTIIGGTITNPNQYATLDAKGLSSIMFASNGTVVVLKYIKFINGKSSKGNGAAIEAKSNMTIENCQFINNNAQNGGALYLDGYMYHVIKHDDPTWESYKDKYHYDEYYHQEIQYGWYEWMPSNPYDYGKYYYEDYSSDLYIRENFKYTINNCQFSDNNATTSGGSIYYKTDSYSDYNALDISNSVFSNNVAKSGGAIYSYYGVIKNCNFNNNRVTVDGGAIYTDASARIQYCNFTENIAGKCGGAVYGWFWTLERSKFTKNNAENGGAVYGYGTIQYSNFTYNYATSNGGATNYASATSCNFNNNNALRGGAAYSGTMRNNNFTDNTATEGGAVYSSSVYNSKFDSNKANYGGAVYCTGSSVQNNNFTNNIALDSSTGIYISSISTFNYIKGNRFSSDKTEIVIKKITDFNGLNIVILDNQSVEYCEGEIKIYASVTNDEGTMFSCEEIIFLVGNHELKTQVIDNYAEVMFNATPDDNSSVIGVKTSSSTTAKISTAFLKVYPYVVYIEFDDAHGFIDSLIQVPIYVYDSTGHPVSGSIFINYNGNHREVDLKNGRYDYVIRLPSKKITLDLIVEYDDVIEVRKINVLDPDDPIAVIIEMPENETGYVGKTVTVPINMHDGLGTQLKGDIHVSYLGHEETVTLNNGKADISISLPVYETYFDLGVSYKGYNALCRINVVDPTVEADATINIAHSTSGNIGETIKIPVKVVDDEGNPLTGNISVSYFGNEFSQALNSTGQAEISITLPDHEVSFEIVVNYNGNVKSCMVESINPTNHTYAIINVNETYTGVLGKNITIPVKVTDDAGNPLSGVISVSYNGHYKTETLQNGQANVLIELPAAENSFELVISYMGHVETSQINVVYEGAHVNAVITLPSTKTENTGKLIMIPVKVTDGEGNPLEGDVAIYYAGNEFTQTLNNGSTNIVIDSMVYPANFEVTVAYHANMAHCIVNVVDPTEPVDAVIILPERESGHVGKTIVIPVRVVDSEGNPLQGNIDVYYDGHEKTEPLHNGNATIVMELPGEATEYTMTVIYRGITRDCTITVKPESDTGETNDTTVTIELEEKFIGHSGRMLTVPVYIHDGKGNALEGKFLVMYNHNEREVTLDGGRYDILIGLPVNPTTFELAVNYEGLVKKTTIVVLDSNNPMGHISEIETNGSGSIIIPFPEDATGDVIITIGDKNYTGKVINGKVIVNITNLPNGTYSANVNYTGDGNYSGSQKVVVIVIKDSNVTDPDAPLANITEAGTNGDGTVVIPFPKDATGDVTVTIDGKNYTGKIVDGKVVLDIADLPAGNYTSIVYYSGDENYSSTIKTIVIVKDSNATSPQNPMGDTTQAEGDNGSINIPFPKDATGDVMVEIDGKYYTGRVIDGQVVLDVGNLPVGNYGANVHYFGDGKYESSSRTIIFVIKETTNNNNQNTPAKTPTKVKKASKITAKKMTFKAKKKVKKYSITLKSGKTPLKKVQVTIKVGKKTYKAKTNAKGKATFKISKLTKKGKYTAVIKFKGNKNYKATSKKVKITVK